MRPEEAAEIHDFVQSRWERLVRTAYLLTGDHGEAEDLVQTTLAKAHAAWHRVRASDSPDACVRRMLVNANAARFRKRRITQLLGAAVPEPRVPDTTHRVDQRDALLRALAKLPARNPHGPTHTSYTPKTPSGQGHLPQQEHLGSV